MSKMIKLLFSLIFVFTTTMVHGAQPSTFIQGPTLIESTTTTVTAAGTTTFTVASLTNQQFSGTTTQTAILPDATTLKVGRKFVVSNRSTGIVTVQYNDATTAQAIPGGDQVIFLLEDNSTTNGTWDIATAQPAFTTGNLTDAGTDGLIVTGGTGAVIGSGTSLAQHVADSSHNGYLLSTDWSTFNNKQPAGSYITALTGDVAASGPGSVAATIQPLAVTNSKIANATIDLTTKVTGILPPPNGGGSPTTRNLFVDGLRTDTYTADGSSVRPFKTIMAAVNQIITNADNVSNPYTINIVPASYTETITLNNALLYSIVFSSTQNSGIIATQSITVQGITSTSNNTHLGNLVFSNITVNGNLNFTGDINGTNLCSTQCVFNAMQINNSSGTVTLNNVNNISFYGGQIQGSGSVSTFTNVAFAYVALPEGYISGTVLHLVDNPGGNVPSQYSGNYLLFSNSKFYGTMTIDATSEMDTVETYFGSTSNVTNNGTIHSWSTNWGGTSAIILNNGSLTRTKGDVFNTAPTINAGATFTYLDTGYNATQVAHSFQATGSTSGTVSILPQAAAGTFNFNLPTTAGSSGQVLTSAGGGSSPMTWTTPVSGTVTSVSVVSANGLAGTVATATTTPAITLSTSVTGILQGNGTAISAAPTTGSGSIVLATAPTITNPVVGTQTQGDSSTKAASTAYVDVAVANAVAGVNPAIAVQAATTAASNTSSYTYANGSAGIGATLTGPNNTALTVDGFTFTLVGQRILVKNDTQSPSGAFNGIYYVSALQTGITGVILIRALDYDQPSDINNTGAIPVINGTVNGTTSWVETAQVTTIGTDPLSFTKFTRNPADYLLKASNLSDVSSASTSFNNISPLTTKGDLSTYSTTNTRLPVGTDTYMLVSDSTQTTGLRWTAPLTGSVNIPNATDWVAYTPTFTGLGTVSGVAFYSRRVGDSLEVQGVFTSGTSTSANVSITLGYNGVNAGVTTDGTKFTSGIVGKAAIAFSATTYFGSSVIGLASNNFVYIGGQYSTLNETNAVAGNVAFSNGTVGQVFFTVPISGWTANTTTNIIAGAAMKAPTIQKFTSGTAQTYTTPTSPAPLYIRVKMVGGGGGGSGSGSGSGDGGTGGTTTFGTSLLTATGGGGGTNAGAQNAGGTATINSPAYGTGVSGAASGATFQISLAAGTNGAGSPFGGFGVGSTAGTGGASAVANTGSGGGGAGGDASHEGTGGGGAGGYIDVIIPNPSLTYLYTIGAGGSAGTAGSVAPGGAGGSGYIEVTEYYQ